jgi:hypothetical protein
MRFVTRLAERSAEQADDARLGRLITLQRHL